LKTEAKEILTKLALRVISYLRDEVGLKTVDDNFSIQSANFVQYLFVSSAIFLNKDMSGTIGMSLDKDLIAPIVKSMMFCDITEEEIEEYAPDTVAEALNITLANVIQDLDVVKNGGDVTISTPLILDKKAVVQKTKTGELLFLELSAGNSKIILSYYYKI
jgi:CheY-specific phosphatase CheX